MVTVRPQLALSETLTQFTFDEMYAKKKVGWDAKMDILIGPGTKMQTLVVRSLTSEFKFPWFYDFDCKMTKKLLNHLIYQFEAIDFRVLCTCCDQAGENVGLQNALGVTLEDNTFPNPYDPSRSVLYTYDFWHGLKNCRYIYRDSQYPFV